MKIYQTDQYALLIEVKKGSTIISDQNCDDLIIRVGNIQKSYANSEISFDAQKNKWLFTLNASQTQQFHIQTQLQVRVKIGSVYRNSDIQSVDVGASIIEVGQ